MDGVRTSKIMISALVYHKQKVNKGEIQEMTGYDKSRKVEIFTPHEIK